MQRERQEEISDWQTLESSLICKLANSIYYFQCELDLNMIMSRNFRFNDRGKAESTAPLYHLLVELFQEGTIDWGQDYRFHYFYRDRSSQIVDPARQEEFIINRTRLYTKHIELRPLIEKYGINEVKEVEVGEKNALLSDQLDNLNLSGNFMKIKQ